jgi:hypothetical protein
MSESNHIDEYKQNNRPSFRLNNQRLRFNICGAKYEILETTLQRFPTNTPLAEDEWRAQFWNESAHGEYYLD